MLYIGGILRPWILLRAKINEVANSKHVKYGTTPEVRALIEKCFTLRALG